MTSIRPVKLLLALLVILAGGAARLPMERAFAMELKTAELSEERLNLSLRDELGQSFFIAVLGGFRSLIASLIELDNLDAWENHNYAKVDAAYALCTSLQPRGHHYWDFRAWMSSHNAFDYYKYQDLTRPGLKPWIRQNLIDHAITVLKDGMKHLPDDWRLPRSIAVLTLDFQKNQHADFHEGSQWYYQAWQLRPSYRMLWRNYVYNLAQAEGHELEAWPLLLEAYHSGTFNSPVGDHTPSIRTFMALLYDKVKAIRPETTLPPEFVLARNEILAKEKARQDKVSQRRAKDEAELKEMENTFLKKRPPPPVAAPRP